MQRKETPCAVLIECFIVYAKRMQFRKNLETVNNLEKKKNIKSYNHSD